MNTGAILSKKDIRDYHIALSQGDSFPTEYQVQSIPVKNQQTYPTCTAHALSEIIEYHTQLENHRYYRFSTDFIYGNRNDNLYSSEGMSIRDGLQVIHKYGDVLYSTLPGNSFAEEAKLKIQDIFQEEAKAYKISNYYKINNNINELKKALYLDGPVITCMKLFKDYKLNKKYIYTYNSKKVVSYHAVLIVGWDEDNFILQNSWGNFWGDHGYFKIPQNEIFKVCSETYGTTDNINSLIKPSQTINRLSKIINLILNLIFRTK